MKNKLLFGLIAAILTAGLIFASCTTPDTTAPSTTTPSTTTPSTTTPSTTTPSTSGDKDTPITLNLGTLSCLSGPYGSWGTEEHLLQLMQVDDINEGGGCWGDILGHEPGFRVDGQLYNWKIIAYDMEMDPAKSITACNKLIFEDDCKFIHVFLDPAYLATRTLLIENNIMVTTEAAGMTGVMGPANPYTFRTLLSIPLENAMQYIPWIYNELGVRNVAVLCGNCHHGLNFWYSYQKAMEDIGIEVLDFEAYEREATDFTPQLTNALATNPQMLFLPIPPSNNAGLIVKQARAMGYEGMIFEGVCPSIPTLVELAGWDALEGLYSVNAVPPPFDYGYPQQQWFYDEYEARYGEGSFSGGLFDRADDFYNLTHAIEKANSLDPAAITEAWENMPSEELFSFFGAPCHMDGFTVL